MSGGRHSVPEDASAGAERAWRSACHILPMASSASTVDPGSMLVREETLCRPHMCVQGLPRIGSREVVRSR